MKLTANIVLIALLTVISSFAQADQFGTYREFRDWTVACTNVRNCEARSYSSKNEPSNSHDDPVIDIWQEAGPKGKLRVEISFSVPTQGNSPQSECVAKSGMGNDWIPQFVDRLCVGLTPIDEAATRKFLKRIRNLKYIDFGLVDSNPNRASLSGLAAALLFIDELQGRIGTTTGVIREGNRPSSAVFPVPEMPTLPVIKIARPILPDELSRLETALHSWFISTKIPDMLDIQNTKFFPLNDSQALVQVFAKDEGNSKYNILVRFTR
jgi:hypothetical protein